MRANFLAKLCFASFALIVTLSYHTYALKMPQNHFAFVRLINSSTNQALDLCSGIITGICTKHRFYHRITQRWQLLYVDKNNNELFRLKSTHNGTYVSSHSDNRSVILSEFNKNDPYQKWILYQKDNQVYTLINEANRRLLVSNFKGNVHMTKRGNEIFSNWTVTFFEISNLDDIISNTNRVFDNIDNLAIQSVRTGLVLASDENFKLQQNTPNASDFQKWTIQQQAGGSVKFQNRETKYYLDKDGKTSPPNELADNKDQNWKLTKENDYYYIKNLANNKCLHRNRFFNVTLTDVCGEEERWYIHETKDGLINLIRSGYDGLFNIKNTFHDKYMQSGQPHVVYNTKNENTPGNFRIIPIDKASNGVYFLIQDDLSKKYLEITYSLFSFSYSTNFTTKLTYHSYQRWKLLSTKNFLYAFYNEDSNLYLSWDKNVEIVAACLFSFEPFTPNQLKESNFELKSKIIEVDFRMPSPSFLKSKSKVDNMHYRICSNKNSSSNLTVVYEDSQTKKTFLEYGFKESIEASLKTKTEASAMFMKTSAEYTLGVAFEFTQEFANSKSETVTIKETLNLPPKKAVQAITQINKIENIQIDFNALLFMTLNYTLIHPNGTESKLNLYGQSVAWFLQKQNFNGHIQSIARDGCYVALGGSINADFGLSVQMTVLDYY